ncbi:MAG: XrtA/PEP-CTERM system-associated ATPase [Sphingobium sp.]
MYDQFYGLSGRPFQLTPDPHFYFESGTHRKALSYLGYGLAQGEGFIVITGDIGAGKTTLVGHLMSTIDPARLTAVKIVSTQVDGDDMLRLAAQNFGIASDNAAKAQLLQKIEAFLHEQARRGLRTLLIVDEGQNLSISALEELRMLSNFQLGGHALLQIFLLGQPEFRDLLKSAELEQLNQRVIATHHLDPMLASEVEPYINHRMSVVGWTGNPSFTADAYAAVYAATDGVPRRINALMSRVLLLGAIDRLAQIDRGVVDAVAADMGLGDMGLGEDATINEPAEEADTPVVLEALKSARVEGTAPILDHPVEPEEIQDEFFSEYKTPEQVHVQPELANASQEGAAEPTSGLTLFELHSIRGELEDMRRLITQGAQAGRSDTRLVERLDAVESRLAMAETRGEEQEAALRRVLTLLVDWVETGELSERAA